MRPALRLAVSFAAFLPLLCCGREERPWNVLLITLDTTRADHLGCYGKAGARTPNLDRLAAEGFLFEQAAASNPVTQASHSTILTGVYPLRHGVRDNTFFRLPESRRTLAEILSERGYATAAAIGGFPLTREFGTAQGFDLYDDDLVAERRDHLGRPTRRRFDTWYDERPAGHVNDAVMPWLRTPRDAPFFVWLHYWDPHEPHIAPAPYGELFAHDPYSGEIAYADASLGNILRLLEDLGELERTLVVVTADHGEGHLEHGEMTHAFLAYEATLHVPLIVRPPVGGDDGDGGAAVGRRIARRVGTVDIVPTVLDLLGLSIPEEIQGSSLVPLMRGGGGDSEGDSRRRPYYSESLSPRLSHGFGELRVLYREPWKYIHGPRPELFDLAADPAELHDLAAARPERAAEMEETLRRFLQAHADKAAASAVHEADEATRRRLAALGYLATTGENPDAVAEELRTDGAAPQDRVEDINLQSRLRRQLGGGDFEGALRTASRLLEDAPQNAYYLAALAEAHLGLGELAEAARTVEAAESVTAANLQPFLRVAQALWDDGETDRGLAMARRLAKSGDDADGWLTFGRMLRESGDGSGFEDAARRALELDPEHRGSRLELARHHLEAGDFERAEDELDRLLATYPIDLEGLLTEARLLAARGEPGEALVRIERVLRLAPRFCEALLERLSLLTTLDRPSDARNAETTLRRTCADPQILDRATRLTETSP